MKTDLRAVSDRCVRVAYAFLLVAGMAGCRQQMADQPLYKPLQQEKTNLFADGRASRPLVENTVARGHLRDDSPLFTGKVGNEFTESFPMTITREILERGQQRFNIYCAPCHGQTGAGDGMIVQRGMVVPVSFHDDRLVTSPVGYHFDVITNGFGRMYDFKAQTSIEDRWAIVAYIRALQQSRRATLEDLTEEERTKLTAAANPPAPAPAATGGSH